MRIGRKGWGLVVALTLVCACCWLVARGCAPTARPAPEQTAAPEDVSAAGAQAAGAGQDIELPPDPLDDPAFLDAHVADIIEGLDKPPDLGEAVKGWQAQEGRLIDQIAPKSFEETLAAMADWKANYFKIIINDEPHPSLAGWPRWGRGSCSSSPPCARGSTGGRCTRWGC